MFDTRNGQQFLSDVRRIADSLETLVSIMKPIGDYFLENQELVGKFTKMANDILGDVGSTLNDLEREEAAIRGDDIMEPDFHEPGC